MNRFGEKNRMRFSAFHIEVKLSQQYIILFGDIPIWKQIGKCCLELEVEYRQSSNRISMSFGFVL